LTFSYAIKISLDPNFLIFYSSLVTIFKKLQLSANLFQEIVPVIYATSLQIQRDKSKALLSS